MPELLSQLGRQLGESPLVGVLAAGILLAALFGFLFLIRPALRSLDSALANLRAALTDSPDWPSAKAEVEARQLTDPAVTSAWEQTQARVIAIESSEGHPAHASFGAPTDIWNPQQLVGRKINLPLAEAVPNLLVGVGLLLTFLFLTLAIVSATAALNLSSAPNVSQSSQGSAAATRPVSPLDANRAASGRESGATESNQKAIDSAIGNLLGSAGAKFLTSLVGLLASILWTIAFRRGMHRVGERCDEVVHLIGVLAPPDAGERLARAQFEHSQSALQTADDHLLIAEESLQESREQTGTLKRFETDLAVAIGKAINAGLAPQLEEMTRKLTESIDKLSERMSAINQDALEKMLNDFAALLKKATETEMTALQQTLGKLAESLQTLADKLTNAGQETGRVFNAASDNLAARLAEFTDSLGTVTQGLLDANVALSESVAGLASTVEEAKEAGNSGRTFISQAIVQASEQVTNLSATSKALESTALNLQHLIGSVDDTVKAVQSLAAEQRQVVQSVKDATPNAMRSIEAVLTTLQQTVAATQTTMTEAKKAMTDTASVLQESVNSVTGGIGQYTETVSTLHERMDSYLATAIGQLGHKISSLEEVVEELAEVTGQMQGRGR
jgi:methyl-accepting chemotaxis protein